MLTKSCSYPAPFHVVALVSYHQPIMTDALDFVPEVRIDLKWTSPASFYRTFYELEPYPLTLRMTILEYLWHRIWTQSRHLRTGSPSSNYSASCNTQVHSGPTYEMYTFETSHARNNPDSIIVPAAMCTSLDYSNSANSIR